MAKFTFGKAVDIHWNGYEIVGPALTEFTIPDQLYEEFEGDFRDIEPSLTWTDTNEFATLSASVSVSTLSATAPIALTSTSTGKIISFSSGTALNGYVLAADGSGGSIWNPASTSGLTSVVGVSPISSTVSGGVVSVSLDANYQTAGTYVTSVVGTSPVSASGTTAITVSVDQAAITGATAATNAQVVRFLVKNTTGTTIPKGSAVYVSGATGDNALISLASATSDPSSSKTLGLTAEAIANDAFGYVIEAGYLTDIDTSATTAGAAVWLGNTPGSLVFVTPPAEPSHAVYLGVVVRVQSMNGSILVKVQNGYELDELHDVFVGGVSTALPLVYNSTSSGWVAQALTSVGIADNAIVGSKIIDGAVTSGKIADGSVTSAKIAASAVNSSILADNAVVAAKIAAGAVGSAAIAAGAVNTSAINSGAATSGQLLQANGSGGASFSSFSAGSTINIEVITSSGTWVRPSNCRLILHAIAVGGGSGGGNYARTLNASTFGSHYSGDANTGSSVRSFQNIGIGTETSIAVGIGAGGAGRSAFTLIKAATISTTFESGSQNAVSGGSTTFGSYLSASSTNQSYSVTTGGKGGVPGITTYYVSPTVSSVLSLYTYYGALPEAASSGGSGTAGTVTGTAGTVRVGAAGGAGGAAGKITGGGGGSGVLGTTLAADSGTQYRMSGGDGAVGGGGGGGGSVGVIFSGTQSATLTGGSAGNGSFYGAGGGEAGMVGVLASSSANYTASSFTINVQKGGDGYQGVLILVYLT